MMLIPIRAWPIVIALFLVACDTEDKSESASAKKEVTNSVVAPTAATPRQSTSAEALNRNQCGDFRFFHGDYKISDTGAIVVSLYGGAVDDFYNDGLMLIFPAGTDHSKDHRINQSGTIGSVYGSRLDVLSALTSIVSNVGAVIQTMESIVELDPEWNDPASLDAFGVKGRVQLIQKPTDAVQEFALKLNLVAKNHLKGITIDNPFVQVDFDHFNVECEISSDDLTFTGGPGRNSAFGFKQNDLPLSLTNLSARKTDDGLPVINLENLDSTGLLLQGFYLYGAFDDRARFDYGTSYEWRVGEEAPFQVDVRGVHQSLNSSQLFEPNQGRITFHPFAADGSSELVRVEFELSDGVRTVAGDVVAPNDR